MWSELKNDLSNGDVRALSRSITLVENEFKGHEEFLKSLKPNNHTQVIGITGPPGAGKSTLTDCLIRSFLNKGSKRIGVLCVDPSSPFNYGALLGDRIRMSEWYNDPKVFIRSLATRGSLGGLNSKIIEIIDILRSTGFDKIIIETVGVGQSEIEIAGIADTTIVVLVPESGDEVQNMKAGIMEIADIFVVNKSDRPQSDIFIKNLQQMLAPVFNQRNLLIPIHKTNATTNEGIEELTQSIIDHQHVKDNDKRLKLLTEKAYKLLIQKKMKTISYSNIKNQLLSHYLLPDFNLFKFIDLFD